MRPLGGRTRKYSSPSQEHRSPFADDRFATRMQSFRISPGRHPEILPRPDAHDDPSPQSIPDIEAPPIGVSVRRWFGVQFRESLPLLQLTGSPFGITHNRVRDRLGFGHMAEGLPEKRLRFLSFPTHKQRGWGTVNPLVVGSSPSGPTILIIHGVMALRPVDRNPLVYPIAWSPFTVNSEDCPTRGGLYSPVYRHAIDLPGSRHDIMPAWQSH